MNTGIPYTYDRNGKLVVRLMDILRNRKFREQFTAAKKIADYRKRKDKERRAAELAGEGK